MELNQIQKNKTLKKAYEEAGWRERFAMEHSTKPIRISIGGDLCLQFYYNLKIEYQGGNGATFNTKSLKWIN